MKTMDTKMNRAAWARLFLAAFAALLVLTAVAPAQAAGRVNWKSTTIKERT